MKFILSRTSDYRIHSKKWIVGYGLLFWLVSRLFAMFLIMACVSIYHGFGISPENLTKFIGSPETAKTLGSATYTLLTVSLVAPLLEECIFRLGLSFKKWQIALSAASIPLYVLWQHLKNLTVVSAIIYVALIVTAFVIIYYFTKDSFWTNLKRKYYHASIWFTAIAFGLIHFIAFTNYSFILIPYMLCVISVPFFAGCAMTYYRTNLGFWWGVGLHIFNNLPAIFLMLAI